MFRFTIRDVLWLTVVVGLAVALAIQHQQASAARQRVIAELQKPTTIDVIQMPLTDTMIYLSMMHRIPVVLADEVDQDLPVTAKHSGVPLRTALETTLPPLNLEFRIKDGCILIEPRRR